jgi:hypothetical protein
VPVEPPAHVTVPVQPEAVSVADAPKHIAGTLAETVGVAGFGLTVRLTTLLILLSQPVDNKQVAE